MSDQITLIKTQNWNKLQVYRVHSASFVYVFVAAVLLIKDHTEDFSLVAQ